MRGCLKKNTIQGLSVNGNWIEDPASVKNEIYDHFKMQFSEPQDARPRFVSDKFKSISALQAAGLESSFSEEEIKQAVWSCDGSKAPGPDGFSLNFVKKYWDFLKHDFEQAIKDFEISGYLPRGCNPSFIALIPKVSNPQIVSNYRPISLVSLQYKVLSKLLANRLRKILPDVISDNQSAFLEGRQIVDCVLLANEIVPWAKRSKSSLMLLKIDFAKAFDCVNWSFLDSVMGQMGFGVKWRR